MSVYLGNQKVGVSYKDERLQGIPVSVTNHMVNGKWVRPQEYPDLDILKANIPENEDCVYLTYDLRKLPNQSWIGIDCRTKNSGKKIYIERGHVVENSFVVDELFEDTPGRIVHFLNEENGEIQLIRIRTNDEITHFYFISTASSNVLWGGLQPCVERAGRLMHLKSMGALGPFYVNWNQSVCGSIFTERDAIARGGTVESLAAAFKELYSLQELVTDDWNTKNWTVTSLYQTFYGCWSLESLQFNSWDTSNWAVTTLQQCFQNCYALNNLDLSTWNTKNWAVTSLRECWRDCLGLHYLNIKNWDTKNWNVTSLYNCWYSCISLLEIKGLNDLDTSNWHLTSIASSGGYGPFIDCWSLREIDISKWDTTNFEISQAHTWFNNNSSCQTIKCPTDMGDVSTSTNTSNAPNYATLMNFNGYKIYVNHSYSSAYMLTHDSLVNILSNLPTVTATRTITLDINKLKLTNEEIAIATNKGWTVA